MHAVPQVLSQFAGQASFLWVQRNIAVGAPDYDLTDLSKLDLRVDAHLDGLRIEGEEGWQLLRNELAAQEPGEIFAAAVLALESHSEPKVMTVLQAATKKPDLTSGFVSALGWLDYQHAEPTIKRLCAAESAELRRVGIAAAAVHRKDPGRALPDSISQTDPLLRARALRAAGELGRTDLARLIQKELNSSDEPCRFWAAWSSALVAGYTYYGESLRPFVESSGCYRERALQLALRRVEIGLAHSWNLQLSRNMKSARLAVVGAGVIGDPVLIPWLIEQMKLPPLARAAGEAFTMITGVDLAFCDLDGGKPEGFESGPNDDPDDGNVAMDQDEKLPWPNAELTATWWDLHRSEFQSGVRYLLGKPIREEWMWEVLRVGRQRQRAAAALELAIMRPGEPLFEVRALGFRQLETLRLPAAS